MKIKNCMLSVLFAVCCVPVYSQMCEDLVLKANSLYKAEKYKDAKTMYRQALNCGDSFYVNHCNKRIRLINSITYKSQKSVPFGLSEDKVTFEYQGGQWPVTINGSGTWKVDVESDWCTVKIDKSNNRIIINSVPNNGLDNRVTIINISSGTNRKSITVTSEGAPEILRSSAQNIMFTSEGETNVVDIFANTKWDISNVPSWLKAVKENEKIKFTALANDQNINREACVKVGSPSNAVIIINIIQGAGKEKLSFSKNDLKFGPEGGDEFIRVNTDAEDWKFGDFPHWCQLTRINDKIIKVHCTPNDPINMIREASVNVTTGFQTLGINVSQEAKPIVELIPSSGIGGRTISFGITAGYLFPVISASSGGNFTGSPVNYTLGNNREEVSYSASGGFSIGIHADIRLYKNFYLMPGLNFLHYTYKNEFSGDVMRTFIGENRYTPRGVTQNKFEENYSLNTFEIPILASYRLPITKISHLQFNIGPVISYGLSATMKLSGNCDSETIRHYKNSNHQITDEYYDNTNNPWHSICDAELDLYGKNVKFTEISTVENNAEILHNSTFEASPLKRINVGALIGITYEHAGISIGVSYNLMLTNMANKKFWESDRWEIFDQSSDIVMSGYKQHNNYFQVKLGYTFRY